MRHAHGIRYAVLGIVSRNPEGIHGYTVRRQGERLLGHFWRLTFGEVYRVLDRLAADGLIEHVADGGESARKVYRITALGRRSLDDYVVSPQTDVPRPLRQELAVKLLFASPEHLPEILRLVARQRDAYLQEVHQLGTERRKVRRVPFDTFVTNLLIDGAELAARAELAWLDEVARRLGEQYGARGIAATA
ncbi:MAG: PadR family transcriptional regulator [Deltaproteobacteria bacterium]|nr:PadR family transcriptional regulator [Deltaproteobacteria bacterium]